jgi:hypothetical protein
MESPAAVAGISSAIFKTNNICIKGEWCRFVWLFHQKNKNLVKTWGHHFACFQYTFCVTCSLIRKI